MYAIRAGTFLDYAVTQSLVRDPIGCIILAARIASELPLRVIAMGELA